MGGTSIKIGLVRSGKIIASTCLKAHASESFIPRLNTIKETVNKLLIGQGLQINNLKAIGLAFPSIVDSDAKKILTRYVKFVDADELDLPNWAKTTWGIPLALENDARAALVGEWKYGAGQGCDDLLMVTLGTGVGSAVLMNGQLLKGAHFRAGNIGGHMILNYKGDQCNCGLFGCLESEASGWVLHSKFGNYPGLETSILSGYEKLTFKNVFNCAAQGDPIAKNIRDHCLKTWSVGIINMVHAFDPEIVVLGGGIMNSKDQIIPKIQQALEQDNWLPKDTIRVVPAQHIDDAGLLGAAYLAQEALGRIEI